MGSDNSKMSDQPVDTLIQNNDIVVFVSNGCPYCTNAVSSLKAANKTFEVVVATSQQRSELYSKTGQSSYVQLLSFILFS